MLMEVLSYYFTDKGSMFIHILNLFVLGMLIFLFFFARQTGKKWLRINDYLGVITKTVNSVRYGDLSKKVEKMEIPSTEPLADSINRMIETLYDREKMITEYQTELHRQNKFLEAVINSLSDGLVVIDDEHKILRATAKISEWFNVAGKDLLGADLLEFIQVARNKNLEKLNEDDVFIKTDMASNFVASCMELKLEDKKRRFIIIIKNVTNQKELECLKEDFVATLTHDLKVPIIAETNMLELFLNKNFGPISDKQEVALKNMQSSNKELLDLVQIVLETYKVRDGSIRLYKENIKLKPFIEEIIEEMRPIANKTHNPLNFETNRDICVYADKMQLKRVIKNLIQNAISYGELASPVIITIGEVPKFIVIKVKDFGAGISKEDIDKIFNKYFSAAKKFRKIGTGLGLYLALQIVKSHGGELTVESEEGEYTEFTIKLPAVVNTNLHYGE